VNRANGKKSRNGKAGARAGKPSSSGRGRPPKFGRPSQVIALTLPQDILESLGMLHRDPAWAIVQLVESSLRKGTKQQRAATSDALAELVHLPGGRALIVVQPQIFRRMPGVATIPLADGRAFLAFEHGRGLADLEVWVLDKLEMTRARSLERGQWLEVRDLVRGWRHDRRLSFRTRSIIVAEGNVGAERRPLTQLHDRARTRDGHRRRRPS
jgi:hypothetical protein